MLAAKIFARLTDVLGLELPMPLLFEATDLGAFEQLVENELQSSDIGHEALDLLTALDDLSDDELAALEAADE